MNRLLLGLTVIAVVGFVGGLTLFRPTAADEFTPPDDPPAMISSGACCLPPAGHGRTVFALQPADMRGDRERPTVAIDAAGRAVLAFASRTGENEQTLFLARSLDGGRIFGAPRAFRTLPIHRFKAIIRDKERDMIVPVLARVAAAGERITLAWVEPEANGGPDVRMYVAHSTDGADTFSEPVRINGMESVRPNFTALAVAEGRTACVWLDHRGGVQQPVVAGSEFTESLVTAGPDGKGVCPCCDLDLVCLPGGGVVVAFRHLVGGNRDIHVCRSDDGVRFTEPTVVTEAHWKFDGCPHDGPTLALAGDRLLLGWMDAHTGKRRVTLAVANPRELKFTPIEYASSIQGEQGHPRLATGPEGRVAFAWDEALPTDTPAAASEQAGHHHSSAGLGRVIRLVRSTDGGKTFDPPINLGGAAEVFQTHPALAFGPDGSLLVAWAELSAARKVVAAFRLDPSESGAAK